MIEQQEVMIPAAVGGRACAYLVQTANRFASTITLKQGELWADAKSLMGLRSLGMREGAAMVSAEGEDARNAIAALSRLLENGFAGAQGIR